ncbi:hypothetical protein KEM56_001949, partial [Ascosphaera pollenicola]
MNPLTTSSLRSILRTPRTCRLAAAGTKTAAATALQKRYAQVHDVRFFVSHHDPSSQIVERYKQKLAQKAKA